MEVKKPIQEIENPDINEEVKINLISLLENEISDHIDTLLITPHLSVEAIRQLQEIKKNSSAMITNSYNIVDHITIIDGRVAIDGHRIPDTPNGLDRQRSQYNPDKQQSLKEGLYQKYAESLFRLGGKMINKNFQYPENRNKIKDGKFDAYVMSKELDTYINTEIVKKLAEILPDGYIPL